METGNNTSDIRHYIDVRLDEFRLRISKGISSVLSQIFSILLISLTAVLLFGLLEYALLQWLNGILGSPWGTLIAAGVASVAIVILYLLRNVLLAKSLGRVVSGALGVRTKDVSKQLTRLSDERKQMESKFENGTSNLVSNAVSSVVFAAWAIRKARKFFR